MEYEFWCHSIQHLICATHREYETNVRLNLIWQISIDNDNMNNIKCWTSYPGFFCFSLWKIIKTKHNHTHAGSIFSIKVRIRIVLTNKLWNKQKKEKKESLSCYARINDSISSTCFICICMKFARTHIFHLILWKWWRCYSPIEWFLEFLLFTIGGYAMYVCVFGPMSHRSHCCTAHMFGPFQRNFRVFFSLFLS